MRKLLLLAVFAFAGIVAMAQQDPKAKSILENVTKTTQSYTSIQASFDYVMENKEEGIFEENKGNILMKGDKYQLKLPLLGLEIYCNGSNVWTYMKDANEVSIAGLDEDSGEMMNPSKLFTIYEEGFNYKFVEETADMYVIDLFPQTNAIEYSKIRIQVDKKQMLIKKAEMVGQEGNNYIVKVNDLKTNVPAEDSAFVFDKSKHPGVEVIDLR
ncbi:MAG: outer membrane lipoprotein carrier protein LolA [Mangrovibacterium sp.]